MKYISFAIPCYNSEAYMEKAINSILPGGEDKGTLTSEQIENVAKQVTKKINKKFGGDVRGAQ